MSLKSVITGIFDDVAGIIMGSSKSKLSLPEEDLAFLRTHTNFDEKEIKRWYKDFQKDCPNGRLSSTQFIGNYKKLFPEGTNADQFCSHIFRTLDKDNDGFVDFKEFLLAINVTSTGSAEEKLKWAFKMYDIDGNGAVSAPEMTKIVRACYQVMQTGNIEPSDSAEERAKAIFKRMDTNGDGQVTEEEFVAGCLQDEELSRMLSPGAM